MRLATYRQRTAGADGREHLGIVLGERVVNLCAAARAFALPDVHDDLAGFIHQGAQALDVAREVAARCTGDATKGIALADAQLLAPIPRPARNVVCVGLNYAEHVAESRSVAGSDAPKYPVFFTKPPTCVIGPDEPIPSHAAVTSEVDWEVELAAVIGREGRDIAEEQALDYVFGYTVANDVTARDLQRRHGQWYKGKGLDGFCPLGPLVVTGDEIPDPQALTVSLRVNGAEKQRARTAQMIFSVARLIAEWSAGMTLLPGDILLTGTPSGVGIGRNPPEFLKAGDVVEAEIEGIGVLRNPVGA
jgi:2-keto-4-pentenoate hydratase/2-oxohepta-3-ene-1,7-dioic acid hydratase in catechol pathway